MLLETLEQIPITTLVYFTCLPTLTIAVFLGVFIVRCKSKSISHRVFAFCLFAIAFWSFSIFVTGINIFNRETNYIWNQMALVAPAWIPSLFLLFSIVFPENRKPANWISFLIFIPAIIITALTPTTLNVGSYDQMVLKDWGWETPNGPLYPYFIIYYITDLTLAFVILGKKSRRGNVRHRKSVKYVIFGLSISASLAIITNAIFPFINQSSRWAVFGPVFVLFFIFFVTHAIVRYQWLDIKVIGSKILIIVLITLFLVQIFFRGEHLYFYLNLVVFGVAIVLGLFLARSFSKETITRRRIQRAKEKLEKTAQLKDEFFHEVTHELKNPLTAIKGHSELVKRYPNQDKKDILETADLIEDQADQMSQLVSDLLELARADAGKLNLQRENLDLSALLAKMAKNSQITAKRQKISMESKINPNLQTHGDPSRLGKVFSNLIANALNYTPPEGRVEIAAGAEGDKIVVVVKDNGPGIAPADLPHVFDRFYRGSRTRRKKGTGLGLAIAKSIVKAHEGEISVESEEGKGSKFRITLPAVKSVFT